MSAWREPTPISTAQKPQRFASSFADAASCAQLASPPPTLLKAPAAAARHHAASPSPPFCVSLFSSAAAAEHAATLVFLREASALLAELGALLPWARALDVAPAAQAALAGAQGGLAGDLEPALLAVSRVAFVAEAYLQRAFPSSGGGGGGGSALPPARLAAALPASAPALVARLGALVAQQHASLTTILKYRAEFGARVAAMGEAGVRAAGLGSCVALLAELQRTRAVAVALVPAGGSGGGGGGGGGGAVGGALQAALAVAPWDPSLAVAVAGAVAAGSAGSAEPDVLVLATRHEGAQARTLRVLRLILASEEEEGGGGGGGGAGSSASGSGSSGWAPAPLYLALNQELAGRRPEASLLAFSTITAVTLPLKVRGMPIRSACILLV